MNSGYNVIKPSSNSFNPSDQSCLAALLKIDGIENLFYF